MSPREPLFVGDCIADTSGVVVPNVSRGACSGFATERFNDPEQSAEEEAEESS